MGVRKNDDVLVCCTEWLLSQTASEAVKARYTNLASGPARSFAGRSCIALTPEDLAASSGPASVGPYRVLHQLGAGVLGPVFRAHDASSDRLVAIKVFRLDATPEQARDLAAALEILCARLPRHPCIVTPLAAGLDGNAAWLAEDYVASDTLDARMKRRSAGGLRTVLPVLAQVAEALDTAAEAGLHHGALHPRDILISTRMDVRVTGFGIAEALEALGLAAPVRRPYTAPERASGAAWRRQADVFSLGVLAFELLTGRRPVGHGASAAGLVSGVGDGVDADACRNALSRALSERSGDRFDRAGEFVEALAATLSEPVDLRVPRHREEPPTAPLLAALDRHAADEVTADSAPSPPEAPEVEAAAGEAETSSRPGRSRGARTPRRVETPIVAPPIPFDVEEPLTNQPTTPVRETDQAGPAGRRTEAGDGSPGWDEAPRSNGRSLSGASDEGGGVGDVWPRPARARAGVVIGALVAGAVIGLFGGYMFWGWRPPGPEPRAATRPATVPASQAVVEPEVKVPASAAPAPSPSETARAAAASPAAATPRPVPAAPAKVAPRPAPRAQARREAPRTPAAPRPVAPGSLEIESRPSGARVVLDGKPVGQTPLRLAKVAPGLHSVRLELAGHAPWATTVTVAAGKAARVAGSLERVTR
jgi:serine/threonine-protein kinase